MPSVDDSLEPLEDGDDGAGLGTAEDKILVSRRFFSVLAAFALTAGLVGAPGVYLLRKTGKKAEEAKMYLIFSDIINQTNTNLERAKWVLDGAGISTESRGDFLEQLQGLHQELDDVRTRLEEDPAVTRDPETMISFSSELTRLNDRAVKIKNVLMGG